MSINAHIRSFSHALQFLTRLPAPPIAVFDPADLSRSALWFPVIGGIVGCHRRCRVVDRRARLAVDRRAARPHRLGVGDRAACTSTASATSPTRSAPPTARPNASSRCCATRTSAPSAPSPSSCSSSPSWCCSPRSPARRRSPPSCSSPPGRAGARSSGALRAAAGGRRGRAVLLAHRSARIVVEGVVLALLSAWLAPVLLAALIVVPGIAAYWKYRMGGVTGDCLGAGIEVTETMLLLLIAAQNGIASGRDRAPRAMLKHGFAKGTGHAIFRQRHRAPPAVDRLFDGGDRADDGRLRVRRALRRSGGTGRLRYRPPRRHVAHRRRVARPIRSTASPFSAIRWRRRPTLGGSPWVSAPSPATTPRALSLRRLRLMASLCRDRAALPVAFLAYEAVLYAASLLLPTARVRSTPTSSPTSASSRSSRSWRC